MENKVLLLLNDDLKLTGMHYALDNFAAFQVDWNEVRWPTAEHAYQAAKFMNNPETKDLIDMIRQARSPHDAQKLANKAIRHIRQDWDLVKFGVLKEIIIAKCSQNQYVMQTLLLTRFDTIVDPLVYTLVPDMEERSQLIKILGQIRHETISGYSF